MKMTIRFKPSRAEDARALEYLQGAGCSYSKTVVNAINGYLDAREEENREDSCYYIFAPWFMAAGHRHGTSRCLNC